MNRRGTARRDLLRPGNRGGVRPGRSAAVLFVVAAAAVLVTLFLRGTGRPSAPEARAFFGDSAGAGEGFRQVTDPQELSFPADHGKHPDYQTEWWYYTGNLEGDTGRRFGYQLTFFRRGIQPPGEIEPRESDWAAEEIYMAHLAITDVETGEFRAFERFARGALGLADARAVPYAVWLENWGVHGPTADAPHLEADEDGWGLDLQLRAEKDPVLQGDRGLSPKGPGTGDASQYYSFTRMQTIGDVRVSGQVHQVQGTSWMDHEWSTSVLSDQLVGWDWFSVQLDDGAELMLFQLRWRDVGADLYSSGTYVDPLGAARTLGVEDFQVEVLGVWRSPESGAAYPARWRISVPSLDLTLMLDPLVKAQELRLSYTYWEGAVAASGEGGSPSGHGYVELTGYAEPMGGQF